MSNEQKSATSIWILTLIFGWIAALIFYFTKKEDPFLHSQAKLALNLSLNFLIIMIILQVLAGVVPAIATIIGIVILIAWVGWLVICIMQLNKAKTTTGNAQAVVPAIMLIK